MRSCAPAAAAAAGSLAGIGRFTPFVIGSLLDVSHSFI